MKDLLCISALFALLAGVIFQRIDGSPFGYDEADYMSAARQGVWGNLWDEPSMDLPTFVQHGLQSVRGQSSNSGLSEIIRSSEDVTFYRHESGPLYFLWLHALQSWTSSEASIRYLNRWITLLNLLVIYFGCRWALPGSAGFFAAVTAGILFSTSYTTIVLNELCPHPLYITLYLATLLVLTRAVRENSRKYWLLSLILGGVTVSAMMIGFLIAFPLLIGGWLLYKQAHLSLRQALKDSLYFFGALVVTWPASLLKLSIVKDYAILAYLSLFRKNVWGDLTLGEAWKKRLIESPLDWLFLIVALVVFARTFRQRRDLWPWVAFILATLAIVARIPAYGPRYVTPVVPAMFAFCSLLAGPWLANLSRRTATASLTPLAAACLALLTRLPAHYPIRYDPSAGELLASVRSLPRKPEMRVLAPQLAVPMLHYYFPELRLIPYSTEEELQARLRQDRIDAVIHENGAVQADSLETP
jgi:hypothetical protein